jgi:hypothetical protein
MSGMEIALPLISTAVSAGATGYSMYSSSKAGAAQKEALGISGAAQQMAAKEQSDALEFEARQQELQGKRIRSAAAADEAARRTDLESSLETIQAMRVGRGLDLDSPTGKAIMAGATDTAERNIMTSRGNYMISAAQSDLQAELSRRKARYTLLTGDASAKATGAQIAAADASIDAALAGGIGKIGGLGLDLYKTMKPGYPTPATAST